MTQTYDDSDQGWSRYDELRTSLFSLPGTPEVNVGNSVVAVMDRDNEYMPIRDEHFFSFTSEFLFIAVYCIAWGAMMTLLYSKKSFHAYWIGFAFGMVLIFLEAWSYNAISWVFINNANLRSYSTNFPEVKNIHKGELDGRYTDPVASARGEFIRPEVGDYKVMLENSVIPHSKKDIYLLPAEKYLEYLNSGKIVAEDMGTYLAGQFKHEYGYGNQKDPLFAESRDITLSNSAFYVVIICITWALYTSRAHLASNERMAWLIGAVGMGLLTGGLTYDTGTIRDRLTFLYVMRRVLILSISFAVTAVLI